MTAPLTTTLLRLQGVQDAAAAGLTMRQGVAGLALVAGALLIIAGLAWLWRRANASAADAGSHADDTPSPAQSVRPASQRLGRLALGLLVAVIAAGGFLRLHGLTSKTLTHTEALLPNIEWPDGVSFPPTRTSFYDTFWWHFHSEGHPQGYAFLMWAWTKVFGTGLFALRLPSVLFGVGCLALVFLVGRLSYEGRDGVWIGLLGAALLAANGLHIYWSQYARMYVMGCFLALLSTYLLLRITRRTDRASWLEGAYVVASWLALYTQTFFWPVLAAHALWATCQRDGALARRLLVLQAVAVMLGASSLAHTVYLGDDVTLPGPSWAFAGHFLAFGFLFEPDLFSLPARFVSPAVVGGTVLLAIASLAFAVRVPTREPDRERPVRLVRPFHMLPVALGSVLIIMAFALLAHRRTALVAAVGLLPLLALVIPAIGGRLQALWGQGRAASVPLLALLAFGPAAFVFGLSFWTSMMAPRAFLIFVPFLLLLLAAGFLRLVRIRPLGVPLWVGLVVAHGFSIFHVRGFPSEQIDYASLGRQMSERMDSGDLVFILPERWYYTPLFYYLDGSDPVYVAADWEGAAARHPEARVWVPFFDSVQWGPYETTTQEITRTIQASFEAREEVTTLRGRAVLYTREASQAAP